MKSMTVAEVSTSELIYECGMKKLSEYWANRGWAEVGFTQNVTGESIGLYTIRPENPDTLRAHKVLDFSVELIGSDGEPVL